MKKPVENPSLQTWMILNESLKNADEAKCRKLLADELAGRKRRQFIRRIHSRLNKARADKERQDLEAL